VLLGRQQECLEIGRLLAGARQGTGGALFLQGAAGTGKSALLSWTVEEAEDFRTLAISGVESEMELAFAGLQQLCMPLLDRVEALPEPQRRALETSFGTQDGPPPDALLVGLAVLSLLSSAGRARPLLCIIDDAQWLDNASARALGLAARRLEADAVAVLFATRSDEIDRTLSGLPNLVIDALPDADASALLAQATPEKLDSEVANRILAEARGNPLALLELPRRHGPVGMAGGFAPSTGKLSSRLETTFVQRSQTLPRETQLALLLAAAEPVGDPALLWRAAGALGIGTTSLAPAEDEGLVEVGTMVRFCHPLVRSALYGAASPAERRRVHGALAQASDARADPDRRAWHRALATSGPDEAVAKELVACAGRAQARGGLAAAAAFFERATAHTLDHRNRTERALAAAQAKNEAGDRRAARELLAIVQATPLDDLQRGRAERLEAQIGYLEHPESNLPETALLMLSAAQRLERSDPATSRETYLEALGIAQGSDEATLETVARALPIEPPQHHPQAIALLLKGYRRLHLEGFPAGVDVLIEAMLALRDEPMSNSEVLLGLWFAEGVAMSFCDDESQYRINARRVSLAREAGALSRLQGALRVFGTLLTWCGDLSAAASLFAEADAVIDAISIDAAPMACAFFTALNDERALERLKPSIEPSMLASAPANARHATVATLMLYNSLGMYQEATELARLFRTRDSGGGAPFFIEVVESTARTGDHELAQEGLEGLRSRTRLSSASYAKGLEARSRALVAEGAFAEELYKEAIGYLQASRGKVHLARVNLLYGEWLRREHRRTEARAQLTTALDMFNEMGAFHFAKRARSELLAAGGQGTVKGRRAQVALSAQEARVASLASEGLTNPEIGSRLFLSPNTVDYHLRKVFRKLGIRGRAQLHESLSHVDRLGSDPEKDLTEILG
jgi:DNA-binding CsgD family transcriptional regulator